MTRTLPPTPSPPSPSSRRAWVEIATIRELINYGCCVALLAEGVGRNFRGDVQGVRQTHVALLAEGVGRNCTCS